MAKTNLKEIALQINIPSNLSDIVQKLKRIAEITSKIYEVQTTKRYGEWDEKDPRHSNKENVITIGKDSPKEVSYKEYFEKELAEISELLDSTQLAYLKELGDALKDKEDTDFLKVKTIMHKCSGLLYVDFGPFEQYHDPRHVRTDFQFSCLFSSDRYKKIMNLFHNTEYNDWVPEPFRYYIKKKPNFFIGDLFVCAGLHQDLLPMAQVLPNENSIRREYGTMITIYANISEAKTEHMIVKLANNILNSNISLEKAQQCNVLNTLAHEIMHTVGKKHETYYDIHKHVVFEEGKAISGSLIVVAELGKINPEIKDLVDTSLDMDLANYVRYLLSGIEGNAYGNYSAYALHKLSENGAITINSEDIKINDKEKYIGSIRELQNEMLEVIANKNKDIYESVLRDADEFWDSGAMENILNKARSLDIPDDIKPKFEINYV
jgi:hypothetical protein